VGSFWYETAARKDAPSWSALTHVQSILSYAYCGSPEKLGKSVTDILAGKEVVIPAVLYTGDSNGQRLATFKNVFRGKDGTLVRLKASLRMPHSPLDGVQIVGTGAGAAEDVPALLRSLGDRDPLLRRAAAEELGQIGPLAQAAIPALGVAQKDADARVRIAAAGARFLIDPKQLAALDVLAGALKDPSGAARRAAAQTLAGLGPQAAVLGAPLANLLGDRDEDVRWAAADALGELGAAAAPAVPALVKLLGDRDPSFRSVAADALGQAAKGNPPAVSAVLGGALKDPDLRVRESAARSLLELGLPSREAAAILAARKDDPWVYAVTLAFLFRSGGPEAAPFVVEGIKHPSLDVRMAASNLLLQVDPQAYKPAMDLLIEGLKDPHYFVSARCARCLFQLGPEARRAAPALLELLKEPHRDFWEARSYAAVALGTMGMKEPTMIPALAEAVQQPAYKDLRLHAARFLGERGAEAKAALGPLKEAAKDKDREVAQAAAEALRRIEPGSAAAPK
jgi:HEAT repeat protein